MVAIDTNVLVYAQRAESAHHRDATALLGRLASGRTPWALPWPCVAEYLRVVTHPGAFRPATPMAVALGNLEALLASPSLQVLSPTSRHLAVFRDVLAESAATGGLVFDAEIFAVCLQHGVREILTADKDFRRFSGIRITDPFA